MRARRIRRGVEGDDDRSRGDRASRAASFGALLAVAAACGGCDEGSPGPASEGAPIVQQTPEEGHRWDTEDPNAARAPRGVLVVFAVLCALWALGLVVRRMRRAMRTSRATTAAPRLPIRISDARRTQILDGNGARSAGHRPGAGRPAETEFPASMSDRRLLATVERIANDPAAYRSGTVPKGRGRFVAAAHVVGSDGKRALVKVVVEPDGEGVLAAHPGGEAPPTGDVPRSCGVATTPQERVREALARARAVLPASSAGYERASPRHADSIGTLAEFEELVSQNEMEMALYALAEIARDVDAGPSCWSALDEAADFLGVRRRRRSVRSA